MRASWASSSGDSCHRSFFRMRLSERAQPTDDVDPVQEYLISQANLRGFHGAYTTQSSELDSELSLEEIIAGLLMPHADADGRVLKLVLRILQSGQVDLERLLLICRAERALGTLAWLVELVPEEERSAPVVALSKKLIAAPPRDFRRPKYDYSPQRLIRKVR
ncbi:MAG: hypothetical protein HYV07_11585 [Deltaproteobacteria bacterium]|nr:hypothetical protein [Deltaproteobacteria bacterium]